MNSTYHWTSSVRLVRHPHTEDLFDIGITYSDCSDEQVYHRVHVPEALQQLLRQGPAAIQMETLEMNGVGSGALPGAPHFVVVAVTDSERAQYWHLPRAWRRMRLRNAAAPALIAIAALALVLLPISFHSDGLFAAVTVILALSLVRARQIYKSTGFKPFAVLLVLGNALS